MPDQASPEYRFTFIYAGCSNIPLFFTWPGQVKQGKVVEGLAQHIDIFPTVLDLVGLECPPGVQGRSQKSLLTSDSTDTGYDFVYMESIHSGLNDPGFWNDDRTPPEPVDTFTIRSLKWRLTFVTGESGALYDLEQDPDEFYNLWSDPRYEKEKHKLIAILLTHIAATRDPLPIRTKPY